MAHANDTHEWAGMYAGDPISSIDQYVCQRTEDDNVMKHMQDFTTFIEDYWDDVPEVPVLVETSYRDRDTQCQRMILQIPWLAAFTSGDGALNDALEALNRSPNHCTRLLRRFLVLLGNHIIMAEWKMEALDTIKSHPTHAKAPLLEFGAGFVARFIKRQCERQHTTVRLLWRSLQKVVKACSLGKDYQMTSPKVANFCLLAGCPASAQDPLKNVAMLREHLASRSSESREADLRREIEELKAENQIQQRIITNLTFRYLLEHLPPTTNQTKSATARWTGFFKNALGNAQNQSRTISQPHPFDALLCKYKNLAQVETVGAGLYSTLSTNIHHFSSQYTISKAQWNTLEYDIMQALTPVPSSITAGGIDWQKERQRY